MVVSRVYTGLISLLHTVKYKSLKYRGNLIYCFELVHSWHPALSLRSVLSERVRNRSDLVYFFEISFFSCFLVLPNKQLSQQIKSACVPLSFYKKMCFRGKEQARFTCLFQSFQPCVVAFTHGICSAFRISMEYETGHIITGLITPVLSIRWMVQ